jgi:hypothetical protein
MRPTPIHFSILIACMAGVTTAAAEPDLTTNEVALLRETLHLCRQLGPAVWSDWTNVVVPICLRTRSTEFLLLHPSPPAEFRSLESKALGEKVWIRPAADQSQLEATYAIGEVQTVVMSFPTADFDPCVWVLKAAHELFHCHQGLARVVNPFIEKYATNNELNFPFPYDDAAVQSAFRLEAEIVRSVCSPATNEMAAQMMALRLLRHSWVVEKAVLRDPRQFQFKQWMEWSEGVARYTERQLADVARDSNRYRPLPEFAAAFAGRTYHLAWESHYKEEVNPIRFVGEGVRGSVMFYYLGMGKAYALDRLVPSWKAQYRARSLDALIEEYDNHAGGVSK